MQVIESHTMPASTPYRHTEAWRSVALVAAVPRSPVEEATAPFQSRPAVAAIGLALFLICAAATGGKARTYLQIREAKNTLRGLGRAAVAAYERGWMYPPWTHYNPEAQPGEQYTGDAKLCKSSTMVPQLVPRGVQQQTTDEECGMQPGQDWSRVDRRSGWVCLKYRISNPTYYSYQYTLTPDGRGFVAEAWGDLDGDGVLSHFSLSGRVVDDSVRVDPEIVEENPEE
ncbi:MAG: hypothetical protein HY898_18815 [Deltaproteobacteria bacterium]|nr:hypothetical protein [Deltaproteobacteria bacterium]